MTDTKSEPVETQTATLDDLYKEAGIPEVIPQTQAAPVAPAPAPVVKADQEIPDPYDDKHKDFLKGLMQDVAATKQAQQEIARKESERDQRTAAAKLEEDINEATAFVKEIAGLDHLPYSDAKKLALANFELNERAKSDPKFKALWDNRHSSPQATAAFKKSLDIISKDIAKQYESKTDSKLVSDKRALAAARQSSATTDDKESQSSPGEGLVGAEFDRWWSNMARVNN